SVIENDISDVEILIVNDGSTDSSRAIMEKYQSEYSQIRVYDKKNEGVSSARNYGLMKSKGDWVWFIDSDDAINQGSLKYIKEEISDRNNKFDILVFKYLKFKRNSDVSKISDIKIPNEAKAISKFQAMKSLL
ncbi:glycosyltransferase family 2 protein, partial [Lactobacillus helveticus]